MLEGDLVDACKPGDRVMITGVYKPVGSKNASNMTGIFRSLVIGNSVRQLSKAVQAAAEITVEDLREMKHLASQANVLDTLGMSMAPSIYGHEWIKKVPCNQCFCFPHFNKTYLGFVDHRTNYFV